MKTNWKEVAETLGVLVVQESYVAPQKALRKAIRLCLLAAELPLGEAERVLEAAETRRLKAQIELAAHREVRPRFHHLEVEPDFEMYPEEGK